MNYFVTIIVTLGLIPAILFCFLVTKLSCCYFFLFFFIAGLISLSFLSFDFACEYEALSEK